MNDLCESIELCFFKYFFRKGIRKKTGTMFSSMPLKQLNMVKVREIQAVFI